MRFWIVVAMCVVALAGCGEDDDKGSGEANNEAENNATPFEPPFTAEACGADALRELWVSSGGADCFDVVSESDEFCIACETKPVDGTTEIWLYREDEDCMWPAVALGSPLTPEEREVEAAVIGGSCL